MVIPTHKNLEWDSTDGGWLEDILGSDRGKKLLSILALKVKPFLDGECPNKTLVRMGEVKGAQDIIEALVNLTIEAPAELQKPVKEKETYPSLDDDSQWEDGLKTTPEPTK